jgi:quercetin dioxygenase-like cupin family protein
MPELATPVPTVRATEDVQQRWFYGGGVHSWLATAEDTCGAFLLFSDVMDQGKRTPLHTHPTDETLYVTDGTILVHVAGVEHRLDAGGIVIAPRDVPHAFMVVSESATLLTLHTPGSCQAFYLGASEPLTDQTRRVVDFDRVRESAVANGGIEILGPPPFPPG